MSDQPSIAVFSGSDEFAVKEAARDQLKQWLGDQVGDALEIIDADAGNAAEIVTALDAATNALQQAGLFGGDKVVWLRDAAFVAGGNALRAKQSKERLAGFAAFLKQGLPPGHRLLITAPGLDKRTAFAKAVAKLGRLEEHLVPEANWRGEKEAREQLLPGILREFGLEADGRVIDLVIGRVGVERRRLHVEINKLDLYLGPKRRKLTAEDIYTMVPATRETAPWDLPDALAAGDLGEAMRVLQRLFDQRESPVRIIGGIARRYRELLAIREALDRNWVSAGGRQPQWNLPEEAPDSLREIQRWHPFRVSKAIELARRLPRAILLKYRALSVDTHEALMSSPVPPHTQIELLMLRLHALRGPGSAGGR